MKNQKGGIMKSLAGSAVILSTLIAFGKNAWAHWGGGYGGWGGGPGMMGWGYGMGWVGMIFMAVFGIAVILGIIFLARGLMKPTERGGIQARAEDSALEILKRRYAKGEIEKAEFVEKKNDLM
jgi:putative membrane protein